MDVVYSFESRVSDFFHFYREGKHNLVSFSSLCQFNFFWVFFFFHVSLPSASFTESLMVICKQLFPLLQHILTYLCCETHICVVNGHAQYKLARSTPTPGFDLFFSIQRPQVKAARHPLTTLISLYNSAKNIVSLSCFPDVISVSNGNHMLNANTTSSMSAPSGSCDAPPPSPHALHPNHPQPLMSPLLFPTESDLLHRVLFCSSPSPFFFLQLLCHSNRRSLTLQAS